MNDSIFNGIKTGIQIVKSRLVNVSRLNSDMMLLVLCGCSSNHNSHLFKKIEPVIIKIYITLTMFLIQICAFGKKKFHMEMNMWEKMKK